MLSAAFRPGSHNIRSNPFIRQCLRLSVQRNAPSLLDLTLCDYTPRARHASNTASAHIATDSRIPHSSETTSLNDFSELASNGPTSTPLDSPENQSSVPIQKKRGRPRKGAELKAEDVSLPEGEKGKRKTRTREPKPKPDLPKETTPPQEPLVQKELGPQEEPENQSSVSVQKKRVRSRKGTELQVEDVSPPKSEKSQRRARTSEPKPKPDLPKETISPQEPLIQKELEPPKEPETGKKSKASKDSKASKEPKVSRESKASKAKPSTESKPAKPLSIANLPPKQIEDFLNTIERDGGALTMAEVERYKPAVRPSESSSKYEPAYKALMSILLRSFRVEQFEEIATLYGLKPAPGSSRTKKEYAALLMENAWGWTSVAKVQEKKRDQEERVDISIQLNSLELSLLLGQDGNRLQEVAARYSVKVHINRGQTSLRLIGRLGDAKRFQGYLDNFRQDIVTEEIPLPLGGHVNNVDNSTVEEVSRITGVFIEKEGEKLYTSFLKTQRESAENARCLVAQAQSEKRIFALPGALLSGSPSLYTNHDSHISYSLFPFAAHRGPSWKDSNRGTFRLRRIGHWLDTIHPRDGIGLEDELRQTSSVVLGHSRPTGLYDSLVTPFSQENPASDISISVTCGHILFSTPSSQRHSLRPPLPGQLTINNILGQSKDTFMSRMKFQPCTPSVLESQAPQERIQRLTYIADQVADISMERLNETLVFETRDEPDAPQTDAKTCYMQKEFMIELMMPDRPLDMQISATSSEDVNPSDWSDQFNLMNHKADATSHLPLTLTLHDKTYTLLSHLTIHRRYLQIGTQSKEAVTVDKILDNHSGLTTSLAKITSKEHQSEPSWKSFLRRCDRLTAVE